MEAKQVFEDYENPVKAPRGLNSYCRSCGTKLGDVLDRKRCLACKKILYSNPFPAVCTLVSDGSSVLLCKRQSKTVGTGKWCLPAGYIEWGEDFITAGRREVLEETGLTVQIDRILSVVSNFFSPNLHSLVIVLHAKVLGGVMQAGDDADQVAWYDPLKELPPLAFEADVHIIERFFQSLSLGVPVEEKYGEGLIGLN